MAEKELLNVSDVVFASLDPSFEPFRYFPFHPQVSQASFETFDYFVIFGLFQEQFQTQIQKHKFKNVIFILLRKVFKFDLNLVEW